MKGGSDVYLRQSTLDWDDQIPTVVFYCEEHEHLYLETNGLTYSKMPKDHLQHLSDYLTYQRDVMIRVNTPRAERWLPYVNGLKNNINEIISHTTAREASGGQGGIVIKETVKEIVKIPCRYCGVLNDQLNSKCASCGAALK